MTDDEINELWDSGVLGRDERYTRLYVATYPIDMTPPQKKFMRHLFHGVIRSSSVSTPTNRSKFADEVVTRKWLVELGPSGLVIVKNLFRSGVLRFLEIVDGKRAYIALSDQGAYNMYELCVIDQSVKRYPLR